jgi:hypothetical protein
MSTKPLATSEQAVTYDARVSLCLGEPHVRARFAERLRACVDCENGQYALRPMRIRRSRGQFVEVRRRIVDLVLHPLGPQLPPQEVARPIKDNHHSHIRPLEPARDTRGMVVNTLKQKIRLQNIGLGSCLLVRVRQGKQVNLVVRVQWLP